MVITREVKEVIENTVSQAVSKSLQNKDLIKTITETVVNAVVKTLDIRLVKIEESVASLKSEFANTQLENENELKLLKATIDNMNQKNEETYEKFERIDQANRKKVLRIFNVTEKNKEDTRNEIIHILNMKLAMNLTPDDITLCYRVGSKNNGKPRGIYLKLKSIVMKQDIYAKKKMLKGTSIVIKEDLTSTRVDIVNQLTEKIGYRNVWTNDGKIYTSYNGKLHIIKNRTDFQKFMNNQ